VRRGEIWWGAPAIPGQDQKRRPFLVVSDDVFNRNDAYTKVLVVHLTTVRRTGEPYPWEVEIPRGGGAIPKGSVAKCAEVYTLFKRDLDERIGALSNPTMAEVDHALSVALGLRQVGSVGRPLD